MADYTQNCNLVLPKKSENYDVEVANTNNKIIDTQLGNKVEKVPGKGLSSNDFTNNYKNKLDTLQNIYRFMGAVDTVLDLPSTGQKNGDVYNVVSENKDYAWNNNIQQWVGLGSATNLDNVVTKDEVKIQHSLIVLDTIITANTNYTIPLGYKVGNNSLEIFYCSTKLQKRSSLYRNRRKWKCIKYNTIYRVSWRFRYDWSRRFRGFFGNARICGKG